MPQAIRVVDRLQDQADVAISGPSNGHLLTYNSATGKWENQAAAGGGGGSLTVQEVDGTPAVPGVATLILPNGTLTDNGGGAVTYTPAASGGGGSYLPRTAPPAAATWTWINQGTASAADVTAGVALTLPTGSSDNLRGLVRTIPTAPYTVIAALLPLRTTQAGNRMGLWLRESSTGKLVIVTWSVSGAFNVEAFNSVTSFNSSYSSVALAGAMVPSLLWIRLVDDGTNRKFSMSLDGETWVQTLSQARTTFITPDQIGIVGNNNDGTYQAALTLVSWAVS